MAEGWHRSMHTTGWLRPEAHHYARLKCAGPRAANILNNIVPADSADAAALVEILNQGGLGSCTTNAVAQMVRAEQLRTGAPERYPFLSQLWAYTLALAADGMQGHDVGTQICTVIDRLAQHGFPPESVWPYDVSLFGDDPPLAASHYASDQRVKQALGYHQIDEAGDARIEQMRRALTAGKLVVFGTLVTKAFCSESPSGTVMRPEPSNAIAAGHALTACGYEVDPATGRLHFRVANSWGKDWGEQGFCWFDYAYLTWGETSDLWIAGQVPRYSEVPS